MCLNGRGQRLLGGHALECAATLKLQIMQNLILDGQTGVFLIGKRC